MMELLTMVLGVTVPVMISNWLVNKQTQKIVERLHAETQRVITEIVENTNRQTHRVIAEIVENTNRQTQRVITEVIESTNRQTQCLLQKMSCMLEKMHGLQEEMVKISRDIKCLLRKIDFGLKANALMHGWQRLDGIEPEDAEKLPEPKIYDPELKVCYFKSPASAD
ncbi:MAG: hypothetical protein N2578_10280 [Bdellovibrionaceae bacterium]|nr:hypothetical protein [Pseudobdellovibrionaceae bacterium]